MKRTENILVIGPAKTDLFLILPFVNVPARFLTAYRNMANSENKTTPICYQK